MSLEDTRKKLLNKFKEEADIHLLSLQRRLVDLESNPQNKEYLGEIFRAAHTIKGSARLMNFIEISDIAHEMENIFAAMRDGTMQLQPDTNDLLFEAVDTINTMTDAAIKGETPAIDVPGLKKRLAAILPETNNGNGGNGNTFTGYTPNPASPPGFPGDAPRAAEPPLLAALESLSQLVPLKNGPDKSMAETPGPVPVSSNLRPVGALSDNVIRVEINKLDELMNITGELVLGKLEAETTLSNLRALQELLRQRYRVSIPVRNLGNLNYDLSKYNNQQIIRDTLSQLNVLDQQIDNLIRNTLRDYEEHTSQLVNRVDELESNVKNVRMLPIETIYQDFPLSIRNMVKSNGRELPDFRMFGGEIELDKKVLEGIRDPLIHIIRNALDHGIEPGPIRLDVGKPRAGRLVMSASQDGGYVIIKVSDDGAGIDPDHIRRVGVEKKFISEARAITLSDEDIINLLYEPGFSTSPIITDLSGRGVGMEIVKTNLERLGGQVGISSEKGVGTTVTLRVPVTLATSRALMVKVNGFTYAILAPSVEYLHYISPEDILSREGRDVILYGNALIPLVRLQNLLGDNTHANHPLFVHQQRDGNRFDFSLPPRINRQFGLDNSIFSFGDNLGNNANIRLPEMVGLTLADPMAKGRIFELQQKHQAKQSSQFSNDRIPAVVLGSGDRRVCFLVDELVDETEIVVKNLSPLLVTAPFVKSATVNGSGQVVLILDVPNLIAATRNYGFNGQPRLPEKQVIRKRILVVDDSITTRELERSILEAQGYQVDLANDGNEALELLKKDARYSLIITDVEMPNMSGFELTRRIKADPQIPKVPVIIVSSLNNEDHKRRGIEAGAQAYIIKGNFEQANLLSTIEFLTSR
jgi:two-component system chemotaxis sensor kinase CheA